MNRNNNGSLVDHKNAISFSPLSPTSSESVPTPRLEIGEIDAPPFSDDFNGLFEGLGLHTERPFIRQDSPDLSYDIENITNLKDIAPGWEHDDIEEIVVMSPKRPRATALSTIREACYEHSPMIPSATLSEFSFEPLASRDLEMQSSVQRPCVRRHTGVSYTMRVSNAFTVTASREQAILETIAELRVQFVLQVNWLFQEGGLLYFVHDIHPRGNLFEYIKQQGTLYSSQAVFYASELVVGLSSLHIAGIVHRGLCPSSILVDGQGHLIISDFTHAELISSTESPPTLGFASLALDYMPPEYYAPEILLGWSHNGAVDCWSFGMTLFFLFSGGHPFIMPDGAPTSDHSWIYHQILKTPLSEDQPGLPSVTAVDLVAQCLERNPSVRCTMKEMKDHPYFDSVDWEMVSLKQIEVPFIVQKILTQSPNVESDQCKRDSISLSSEQNHRYSIISMQSPDISGASELNVLASLRPSRSAPALKISGKSRIPSVVAEEDEPVSELDTLGHAREEAQARAEKIARLWDDIDNEERKSIISTPSQEFGVLPGGLTQKPFRLRKYRSSIHPRHRLFNISTTSFHSKLKRKPRSTSALHEQSQPKEVEIIKDLPMGIHQMGSGIGFTYNIPSQAASKHSICTSAPPCGYGLFSRKAFKQNSSRFMGLSRRAKTSNLSIHTPNADPVIDISSHIHTESSDQPQINEGQLGHRSSREVLNSTFLQDMYHSPSWIISPPDNIPSPIIPTSQTMLSLSSPQMDSEPHTPATLVEMIVSESPTEDEDFVPKAFSALSCDMGPIIAPTLRLVPSSRSALRMSFVNMDDVNVGYESVF